MGNRSNPLFISITDFTSPEEALLMLSALQTSGYQERKLGIGVMMSRKTLRGIPTKWADVFPKNERVAEIFLDHPSAFNVLHYADYNGETGLDDLRDAIRTGGKNIHALQLDMPWPDPEMIQRACDSHSGSHALKIILQVGSAALKAVGDTPSGTVEQLSEYDERCILQYVLLDRSMGQGRPMDAVSMIPFVEAIHQALPDVSIVVAGGLGPETVGLARLIIERFPGKISIDAQGKLRPNGNAMDPIDWGMAENYLLKAIEQFRSIEG